VHEQVIAELYARGAGRHNYAELPEAERVSLLLHEIATPRTLKSPHFEYSAETAEELRILETKPMWLKTLSNRITRFAGLREKFQETMGLRVSLRLFQANVVWQSSQIMTVQPNCGKNRLKLVTGES